MRGRMLCGIRWHVVHGGQSGCGSVALGRTWVVGLAGLWWRRDDGNPRADNR